MSSDDFRRSVRPQSQERSAGDAPNMGRVTRMKGAGLPKGERRTRKRGEGGRSNKVRQGRAFVVKVWSVLLVLAAVLCLVVVTFFGLKRDPHKKTAHSVTIPAAEAPQASPEKATVPVPSEEEAISIARKGLTVTDPEEIPRHFRTGRETPAQVSDFLKALEGKDGPVTTCEWLSNMNANGLQIEGVLVHFKAPDGKPRNRVALLTPDTDGVWKIDFEAFARRSYPAWPEFLEGSAESIQCRVYLAQDNYYNGPFSDDTQWVCIGMASPDTEEILYGYCKIGSPQVSALQRILSSQASLGRATVEIKKVPGALPRQYVISQVLAEDWVTGDMPFDQRFE